MPMVDRSSLPVVVRACRLLVMSAILAGLGCRSGHTAPSDHMVLAVQTHFSQGWPLSWMAQAKAVGASAIRDGLPWATVETSPGVYHFRPGLDAYMREAKRDGLRVIVAINPDNPLYDGGKTANSPEAIRAYAAYLCAALDRYGDTIEGVEVGNEINTGGGMTGPAAVNRGDAYARLLAVVYPAVKARRPDVKVLGASTNVIGTGFIASVFRAGGLPNMDGVVVHPYRSRAEGVDIELGHLNDVMAAFGPDKPIYATEFGGEVAEPAQSPALMLKMYTMLGAAHVALSSWYVLHDEANVRNMGLFTETGAEKPAARAFRLIETSLAPRGDPVRVDGGGGLTYIYRYPGNVFVMWGAPQAVTFSGDPRVRDAQGAPIAAPLRLSEDPIVVDGAFTYKLGDDPVVADSLLQYGRQPWSYFARTSDGKLAPLSLVDWDWTSYMGGRWYKPLRINADGLAPGGDGQHPIEAVERYTAKRAQSIIATGSFAVLGKSAGVTLSVMHDGKEILHQVVAPRFDLTSLRVDMAAGDTLDFAIGPVNTSAGSSTSVRIRLMEASTP